MESIRIKQTVTPEGINIPFNKVRKFKGEQVEIIISNIGEIKPAKITRPSSLTKNLKEILEQYKDVKPFKNIDPLEWEREIRNEW